MINLTCKTCGSNSFKEQKNTYICQYCNAVIVKVSHNSKPKQKMIIWLLALILLAIFISYNLLDSVKNDIQNLTKSQISNNKTQIDNSIKKQNMKIKSISIEENNIEGSKAIYSLYFPHPSINIQSSNNKVLLMKTLLNKGVRVKRLVITQLGTFVSLPKEYTINYSYINQPKNGYNIYDFYKNTSYDGMTERDMYASLSISELIQKINTDIESEKCKRWSANSHGGNLGRDDNFWTNFCPKYDLVTHLSRIVSLVHN